jgi:hypothetical protein
MVLAVTTVALITNIYFVATLFIARLACVVVADVVACGTQRRLSVLGLGALLDQGTILYFVVIV